MCSQGESRSELGWVEVGRRPSAIPWTACSDIGGRSQVPQQSTQLACLGGNGSSSSLTLFRTAQLVTLHVLSLFLFPLYL